MVLLPPVTGTVVDVGGFISMVIYFGTATCSFIPTSAASVVLINLATRTDFCLLNASGFVHLNSTVSPWWVNPWTTTSAGVGPPTEAVGAGVAC